MFSLEFAYLFTYLEAFTLGVCSQIAEILTFRVSEKAGKISRWLGQEFSNSRRGWAATAKYLTCALIFKPPKKTSRCQRYQKAAAFLGKRSACRRSFAQLPNRILNGKCSVQSYFKKAIKTNNHFRPSCKARVCLHLVLPEPDRFHQCVFWYKRRKRFSIHWPLQMRMVFVLAFSLHLFDGVGLFKDSAEVSPFSYHQCK